MIAVLYWNNYNDSTIVDGIFDNFKELKKNSNYYNQSENSLNACDKPRWVKFEHNNQDVDFDYFCANDFYIKSKSKKKEG